MHNRMHAGELFLSRVEAVIPKKTDPHLMSRIIKELQLHTLKTTDIVFTHFLQKLQNESLDASLLLANVKNSLLQNKALYLFFSCIQENNLISDAEIHRAVNTLSLQVNLLFLFEAIIISMTNNPILLESMYSHILTQRGSYYPGNPFANFIFGSPLNTSLFKRLKMISVDPPMAAYVLHKTTGDREETMEDVQTFINTYQLSSINTSFGPVGFEPLPCELTQSVLAVNILEAAWQDATSGNKDNAIAALGLIGMLEGEKFTIQYMPTKTILPESTHGHLIPDLEINTSWKKRKEVPIRNQWKNFYIAWNLLFVIKNLDSVFLPLKLLIPSVLSAQPGNFIDARTVSLFVMGNIFHTLSLDQNPFFLSQYKFKHADKLFATWGRINKEYVDVKYQKHFSNGDITPEGLLKDALGDHMTTNLIKYLGLLAYDKQNFRITSNKVSFFKQPKKSHSQTESVLTKPSFPALFKH